MIELIPARSAYSFALLQNLDYPVIFLVLTHCYALEPTTRIAIRALASSTAPVALATDKTKYMKVWAPTPAKENALPLRLRAISISEPVKYHRTANNSTISQNSNNGLTQSLKTQTIQGNGNRSHNVFDQTVTLGSLLETLFHTRSLSYSPTELETLWTSWLVARVVNGLNENGILLQVRIEPTGRIMSFDIQTTHKLLELTTIVVCLLSVTYKLKFAIAPKFIANFRYRRSLIETSLIISPSIKLRFRKVSLLQRRKFSHLRTPALLILKPFETFTKRATIDPNFRGQNRMTTISSHRATLLIRRRYHFNHKG
ncbi:MAG TPA: hypothetical protein VJL33_05015 [Candidatus Bathyarchaeia archaeon]|nr:hypothetical protein [Candidatus Bathyarchaeia archaeon]